MFRRELLGKKLMHFKVCSCPKRDMFKDHNTIPKARKREAVAPPPPSVARHPNKMVCTRPTLPQTQIKSEPATPSPPSSTGDGGDVSPLSMFQPQPMPLLLSPDMARDEHLEPKFQMMTEQMVQLTLTVPSSSALHVLRCAYGDIMAKMANDKFNPDQFVPYAEEIQKQIGKCGRARVHNVSNIIHFLLRFRNVLQRPVQHPMIEDLRAFNLLGKLHALNSLDFKRYSWTIADRS